MMLGKLDLGKRKVSKQNFSHMIALPHTFVLYLDSKREVQCILDAKNGTLTLIPLTKKNKKRGYIKK